MGEGWGKVGDDLTLAAELPPPPSGEGTELPASPTWSDSCQLLEQLRVTASAWNLESLFFLVVIRCVKRCCRGQTCAQSPCSAILVTHSSSALGDSG